MTLPYRPRLAAHGLLRHHRVAGRSLFVIHDTRSHQMIELEEDQLVALLGCDGTRDLGGVLLATARDGAYRRASSIESLLHELARRGLLEDGIAPRFASPAIEVRPLEPLPGYRLRCEGHGSCCKSFGSIAFTESEAAQALRAVPEAAAVERVFLPLQGSTYDGGCAVALHDSHCTFLGKDGRCEIHKRAGAEQKPLGCQLYPRSFADDGEAVRVSVRLECPCVFTSLDHADGEPLCGSELAPGTHVPALGSDGGAIRRWSQEVLAALPERGDGFSILWSLAQSVEEHGLEGLSIDEPASWSELTPLFAKLARRTSARAQSAAGWRAPEDRVRQLAEWLDRAARALADGARFTDPHSERDEGFYVRAVIHGHQAALMDQPLSSALRDLAVRVLLARAAGAEMSDDPMAQHPLSAVETMMRAQGLGGWLAQET